jgi:adenylyltransferase/sulfurtransferase
LGSPVLTYLCAAGIGKLGIIDSDKVSLDNLNRQFLHNTKDVGRFKTDSCMEKLSDLNDKIKIHARTERLTDDNAKTLFTGYDIVIGAVDSFETRFVINKACVALEIPYIDGGIEGFSGNVFFSNPPKTPCLNCIYPETTEKNETLGTIGTTAGVIGTIEANIAILHFLGLPNPIENKILLYDGLRMNIDHIEIKRSENCPVCAMECK